MEAISITNLTKTYFKNLSEVQVVDNISLSISKGEVFGFLGPNGAGKTTTIKMIVGLAHQDKGEIKILDKPNNFISTKKIMGFMPENPYFYNYLTGIEFLDFMGEIFDIPRKQKTKKIKQLLKIVGLEDAGKVQLKNYSKGMSQRMGLAQSLINDPEIILLDEPLDGLDPIGRRDIKNIIINLKKSNKTIFFNSHILSDVEEICDSFGIIDQGKLVVTGKIKKLLPKNLSMEEYFVKTINKNRKTK
ncbi:ABC transporter ATP-binding protein [Patescibacteria group bacterium]